MLQELIYKLDKIFRFSLSTASANVKESLLCILYNILKRKIITTKIKKKKLLNYFLSDRECIIYGYIFN